MRFRPLVLVIVLALGLAACGDDSIGDLPDGSGDLPGDVGDLPGGADAGDLGDLGDLGDVGDLGHIPGMSSECSAFLGLSAAMTSVFTGNLSAVDSDILSALPTSAQADGALVFAALQGFVSAVADAGIDLSQGLPGLDQEQLQTFSELSEATFTDEVNDALDRMYEIADASCSEGS